MSFRDETAEKTITMIMHAGILAIKYFLRIPAFLGMTL
jgi:hypothetical protein